MAEVTEKESEKDKDPAALLYIDKWIAATQGMRGDAKGWFLDLILHQYDKGSLPSDVDELASICRIRPSEFQNFEQVFKQVLEQKFKQNDNGRLENPFAKKIIQGRQAFKDKRSHSGKWSYAKKYIIKHYGKKTPKEWNFIYEHFDFSIDLKNEQVFKQVLEQIFELYINANVDVNEDEFRIEFKEGSGEKHAHTVTVEVPRGTVDVMIDKICKYFSVTCDVMSPLYDSVSDFVETVAHRGEMPTLTTALEKYQAYKARSQETIHGVGTWIGTRDRHYRDGQWIMTNWEEKDKNYKQPTKENVRSANQRNTESISARPEGFGSFG